jgi:hypothetical protein
MSKIENKATTTYWNNNGKHQNFYEKYISNGKIDNLPISKTLKTTFKRKAHIYNRFYNDGDIPIRYRKFTKEQLPLIFETNINEVIEKIMRIIPQK